MGLRILKNNNGEYRPTWYGRISVKGSVRETNLDVPIDGTIPVDASGLVKLSAKGDEAFERSRKAAQKAFEKWRAETKKDPAELKEAAHKARTGESIGGIPLAKLYARWCMVKRERKPTPEWQEMVKSWFSRFAAFAGTYARHNGNVCDSINDVTPEIAGAWFEDIKKTYSWETVTKMMTLMRGAYQRYSTSGRANPFADIVLRGGGAGANKKVSRKPLDDKALERLFEITRDDEFVYPLVVTAACTGMRIGDVCNLKWADVDMRSGLIECVTAKAGVRVWIPIFGRLADVLKERDAVPADGSPASPFVFPEAAKRYNPYQRKDADGKPMKDKHGKPMMTDRRDTIVRAVQPYLARAVFGDGPQAETVDVAADGTAIEPPAVCDAINAAGFAESKRARMVEVYRRHKAGERNIEIAAALGVARSQVWMDLREIEKLTGEQFARPRAEAHKRRATRLDLIERTRQQRTDEKGKRACKRAASVYGWHSFRHTFVVLALNAGVPVEKVRQIVGHGEAETTIANYYNPTKAQEAERVRQQMSGTVLAGRSPSKRKAVALDAGDAAAPVVKPSIDDFIATMTEKQRKALAAKLLGL